MMGGFGFGSFGPIGMILNLVVSLALIVGIVLLVVWAVRRLGGESASAGTPAAGSIAASPREILQTRYVRGELTREQYQQMVSDLS